MKCFLQSCFSWESVYSESDHELCHSHDTSPTVNKYWHWEQAVQKYLRFSLSPYVVERACQILGVHMLSFSIPSNYTHLTTILVPMNAMIWKTNKQYTCCLNFEYHSSSRISKNMKLRAAEEDSSEAAVQLPLSLRTPNFQKCCTQPRNIISKQQPPLTSGNSTLWFYHRNVSVPYRVPLIENWGLIEFLN